MFSPVQFFFFLRNTRSKSFKIWGISLGHFRLGHIQSRKAPRSITLPAKIFDRF